MELKEFVTQTLVQIVEGVKDAQEQIRDSGALINPKTYRATGLIVANSSQYSENVIRNVQNIKMNVAIVVSENQGNKSGIGVVASVLKAGVSNEATNSNTTTSHIEFDVPISFPVSDSN